MANITLRSFTINKGEPFSGGITVTDSDGNAVDITGATIDLVSQYQGGLEETDGPLVCGCVQQSMLAMMGLISL